MRWIAFLRGINVGGHHKVPMAALRATLESMGFTSVHTVLHSGNVQFDADETDLPALKQRIESRLADVFGFPIPVMLRNEASLRALIDTDPFADIEVHADIRLYITFTRSGDNLPTVVDLRDSQTVKAMEDLERRFGKDLTTRNWNTVVRMCGV